LPLRLITIYNYPAILYRKLFFPLDRQNVSQDIAVNIVFPLLTVAKEERLQCIGYITRAFVSRKLRSFLQINRRREAQRTAMR